MPHLDGLRGMAVVIVLFSHGTARMWPGQLRSGAGSLGVYLFFLLSGFLIALLLLRERDRYGAIDLPAFFVRRALRIWPLYYAVLGFYALTSYGVDASFVPQHLLFLQNYLVPNEELGLGLALLWTIAVEEHVYLGLPLLLAFAPRRMLGPAVGLATAIGLTLLYLDLGRTLQIGNGYKATHTNMGVLGLGALLAVVVVRWPVWRSRLGHPAVLVAGSLATTAAWLAQWSPTMDRTQALLRVDHEWVEILAVALLVMWAQGQPAERRGLVGSRTMVRVGRLSYGIYLLHPIVLEFLRQRVDREGPMAVWLLAMPLMWVATWILAEAVYQGYEVHFLRLKARFTRVVSRPVEMP